MKSHLLVALTAALTLAACAPQQFLIKQMADELANQAQANEDDLELARDAAPFFLKLSESVLTRTPGHADLAVSVSAGFTQYAFAFVAMAADKLDGTDAKAAGRLRQRASKLYWRAHQHAMRALEIAQPGFTHALSVGNAKLSHSQVDLAYWAAASWGAAIALSKDRPDAVADLPQAVRLAQLAWALEPSHNQGALSALLGSFEAARPGGNLNEARHLFAAASLQGKGKNAGVMVAEAEALALPALDRVAYERLLRQAIGIAQANRSMANDVMRERAQWLLETADDRF